MANGRDLHLDLGAAAKGTWSRPRFWPNGRAKGAMETLLRCIGGVKAEAVRRCKALRHQTLTSNAN